MPASETTRGTVDRAKEGTGTPNVGNPGVLIGTQDVGGQHYARYRATNGTWVSSSLQEQGYAALYGRNTGYGAYTGLVRSSDGTPLTNPDRIRPGQEFLVPVLPAAQPVPGRTEASPWTTGLFANIEASRGTENRYGGSQPVTTTPVLPAEQPVPGRTEASPWTTGLFANIEASRETENRYGGSQPVTTTPLPIGTANPIRVLDRTGLADELQKLGATARSGDRQVEWEAHRLFSELVARSLPQEKTPTTAKEKSVDVDIATTAHDEAVVRIINTAIDAAAAQATARGESPSQYELLRSALFNFVTPLRSSRPEMSQNLVLRDVDHYIVGRIQEWRREIPFESEPPGPTKSEQTVYEGEIAAEKYDADKRESFQANPDPDKPNAPSSKDANSKPASAPGGRFWAWMGGLHLLSRDKPEEPASPGELKITVQDVQAARPEYQRHLEKKEHVEAVMDSAFRLGF